LLATANRRALARGTLNKPTNETMKTPYGHLGYCTNIHAGELWRDHFAALREAVPAVRLQLNLADDEPFGIGLRLSDDASQTLEQPDDLADFQRWLTDTNTYVFTMNGFPFGGFHHTVVKDQVHAPDWTTEARVEYTKRLFRILAQLVAGSQVAGISTSPLSYRPWFEWAQPASRDYVFSQTTQNVLDVVTELVRLRRDTGRLLHLDIEPEPDGLLETTDEFIDWFTNYLIPMGLDTLTTEFGMSDETAEEAICDHVRLCYDVCHAAVGYEQPADVLDKLKKYRLKVGKVQISAALKATFPTDTPGRDAVKNAFAAFNEPTYLHQVVARRADGSLARYRDLPDALAVPDETHTEWRAHFHVPIFIADYGVLQSTRDAIETVLKLQRERQFTNQLEIETYTWTVLPDDLKLPLVESIAREIGWVLAELDQ
jgi:sugar phosphate isomerase/epimerase